MEALKLKGWSWGSFLPRRRPYSHKARDLKTARWDPERDKDPWAESPPRTRTSGPSALISALIPWISSTLHQLTLSSCLQTFLPSLEDQIPSKCEEKRDSWSENEIQIPLFKLKQLFSPMFEVHDQTNVYDCDASCSVALEILENIYYFYCAGRFPL